MKRNKNIITFCIIGLIFLTFLFTGCNNTEDSTSSKIDEVKVLDEISHEEEKESEPEKNIALPDDAENIITTEKNDVLNSSVSMKEEKADIQETQDKEDSLTCTLVVRCDSILEHLDMLDKNKVNVIPENGIILNEQTVIFEEGDSVFDVLSRELKNKKIHFEFVKTPAYDSVYIEGIANLYEFDCGDLSGWLYSVNGVRPTYGCSQYKVKSGDKIEVFFTCNFLEGT